MTNVFLTGTNTEVGKTVASAIVTEALEADYWKPIQCGELEHTDSMKVNQWISNEKSMIHPEAIKLEAPESPHYAASLEGRSIELGNISWPKTKNVLVIEGAGGICVPINSKEFLIDAIPKSTPIILVSKNQLGSINSTLLSIKYLQNQGYQKVAILFNGDEKPSTESIITSKSKIPVLGRINWTSHINNEFILNESKKLKLNIQEFIGI